MDKKRIYNLSGLILVFCLIVFSVSGQVSSDSLNNRVESQLESTTDTNQVFRNAHLSLAIVTKENYEAGLITAYLNLARYHEKYGLLDSAIYYFDVLKEIYRNSENNIGVAETCLELKGLYSSKAAYTECMQEVYEALELYEGIEDQQGIAICYTHICDLLYYEDKYQESADWCDKAIVIQQQIDTKKDLAISYRYKASSLLFVEGALDEALETVNKAVDIYYEIGETGMPLLASLNGRGNILKYMGRYDDAIADYQFIYEKCLEMEMENFAIPPIANIGHVYVMQEKYKEALPYNLKAIDMMIKTGSTKNLWENYMHVSDIYKAMGDIENAYEYQVLYSIEYHKYLNTIIERLESEAQIKYETAKKDEMISVQESKIESQRMIQILYAVIAGLLLASLIGMYRSRKNISKKQKEIEKSREELQLSLESLKATQAQLIHSEKMASLGELTAGIAHEIQNPLNFVNNFSEVNRELISELKEEVEKGDFAEVKVLADDIERNEKKITHHGRRADGIVKGMLLHSRTGAGEKEPANVNTLADEYLRLSFHGLRAKDKSFNAEFVTNFDKSIHPIKMVPQDVGRVILNLINNAFHAVSEKSKEGRDDYKPMVKVSTRKDEKYIIVSVEDNGNGIGKEILDKIFQPFFTTKQAGEGTGLGLSLSYDIITKGHGGTLKVNTIEGKGSEFIIYLPA